MKKLALALLLAVLAFAAFAAVRIGPRNVVGMLRYDHRREGNLRVGDVAPDLELTGLDGKRARLSSVVASRPLILVFGSYT